MAALAEDYYVSVEVSSAVSVDLACVWVNGACGVVHAWVNYNPEGVVDRSVVAALRVHVPGVFIGS